MVIILVILDNKKTRYIITNTEVYSVDLLCMYILFQWFKCDDAWITKASVDEVLSSEGYI